MKRVWGIFVIGLFILVSSLSWVSASIVCEPIDVILISDISTSMEGAKGIATKSAMNDFVNSVSDPTYGLPDINRIGVTEFGTCSGLRSEMLLLPAGKNTLNTRINSMTGMGGGIEVGSWFNGSKE
jgi:hypothetical protein